MIQDFLSIFFIAAGLLWSTVAAIGVLRLPDFFTRSHAVGMMDTLGAFLLLAGVAWRQGGSPATAKILFIFVVLCLVNPTTIHATMRAALRSGVRPLGER
ncbi:MAG: monovalent cation/H(+) antiporter subunit G [Elusimicrobia bacterium]|nr:monovalent cation/H(+) antiporter subunit G [Elusimicrobiota bacterium]